VTDIEDSWIGHGGRRPVGVEIEFGGLDAIGAAGAVQHRFGGAIRPDGPHRVRVEATELGDFKVELDWDWIHAPSDDAFVDRAKAMLGDIGAELVPMEVVTPPVPAGRLPEIDSLVRDLVRLGAEGTRAGLLYAFGLHLNPALGPADLAALPILRVLQAYLLEAVALRAAIDVDPVRTLLPFVERFPPDYADHVLDPDYAPTLAGLIDDYLRFNPTRNRELDLLPLFAWIDADRVRHAVPDPRIRGRPTFHWRLPNADFDAPGWTVARQWLRWLAIEEAALAVEDLAARLAERQQALQRGASLWASLF
jgi:hypothetical protein